MFVVCQVRLIIKYSTSGLTFAMEYLETCRKLNTLLFVQCYDITLVACFWFVDRPSTCYSTNISVKGTIASNSTYLACTE